MVPLESRVLLASLVIMDPPALRDSLAPQAEKDHWDKTDPPDHKDPPEHRYIRNSIRANTLSGR